MGGLQRLLHAGRHVSRPGGAASRIKNTCSVHGLDEGHHDGSAGRPLRGEVLRDGRNAQQRSRVWSVSWNYTGPGGPVPPTGRHTSTDYVYVMQFDGDKIVHMTKIWHAGLAMKELGWS